MHKRLIPQQKVSTNGENFAEQKSTNDAFPSTSLTRLNTGVFIFLRMTCMNLLFDIILCEPSGSVRLSEIGHKGYSSDIFKFIDFPFFAEKGSIISKILQIQQQIHSPHKSIAQPEAKMASQFSKFSLGQN